MKVYIDLGDPSNDGHGRSKKVLLEINTTLLEMQEAYKASCKKLGISFNHNEDYTETKRHWEIADKYRICTEYEDTYLNTTCKEILDEAGCPYIAQWVEDGYDEDYEDGRIYMEDGMLINLLIWFIQQSNSGFTATVIDESNTIPTFNEGNLNVQIGYGLYS